MNLNTTMKKLQRAILSTDLVIKIRTSQFYSPEQGRMITMWILSTPTLQNGRNGCRKRVHIIWLRLKITVCHIPGLNGLQVLMITTLKNRNGENWMMEKKLSLGSLCRSRIDRKGANNERRENGIYE